LNYKILQISFGDGYAGSAKMAILSSAALEKEGHKVSLLASKNSLTERRGTEKKLNVVSFNSNKSNNNFFSEVENYFNSFKPDFVLSYHSLDRKLAIKLRQNNKEGFINIAYRQNMSKSFPVIGQWIYNRYFHYQVACSKGVMDDLIRAGAKRSKVKMIHNIAEFPEEIETISGRTVRNDLNINNNIVLGVSSWFHKERKGFDILFDAFSKTDNRFILLIIGIPKENQDEVYQFASSFGIKEERLVMPGFIDNIYEYYKAMDIFIISSRSEGFSLALLEAAVSRIPIIASDIPGNNEFILDGKAGLLFDLSKQDDLLAKIKQMSESSNDAKIMSSNAYDEIMKNYTLDKYGKKLNAFLNSVFQENK
jgi:glycosyltransferase involved in cell wall biosynthesis